MRPGRIRFPFLTVLLCAGVVAGCKDSTGPTPTPPDGESLVLDLAVGDVHIAEGPIEAIELPQAGQYLMVPLLASQTPALTVPLDLRVAGLIQPTAGLRGAETQEAPHGHAGSALLNRSAAANHAVHVGMREQFRRDLTPYLQDFRERRHHQELPVHANLLSTRQDAAEGDTLSLSVSVSCDVVDNRAGHVVVRSDRALIVADVDNNDAQYSMAEYRAFADQFDSDIYPVAAENFGAPTDLDNNDRIIIFFTGAVNEMSDSIADELGEDIRIGGYVWQGDFLPNCQENNFGEIFYMAVPDGRRNRTRENMRGTAPATLVHEMQHLINGGRTIHVHNGNSFEVVWMEEALSHTAEELLFYRVSGLHPGMNIDVDAIRAAETRILAFNAYQSQNFGRLSVFLNNPGGTALIDPTAPLAARGALWQLFRYIADHRGGDESALWYDLVNTPSTGFQNLTRVVDGDPFDRIHDWAVSVYTDDRVQAAGPLYQQPSWNYRAIFTELAGGFPLSVTPLTADRSLTLRPGAPVYLRFGVGGGEPGRIEARNPDERVRMAVVRIN